MDSTQAIKTSAIDRAVALLKASGATFGVQFGQQTWGRPLALPKVKKSAGQPRINVDGTIPYRAIMDGLAVGDTYTWDVPDNRMGDALRKCVSARGVSSRGRGGVVTNYDAKAKQLTVLIVSPLLPDHKPVTAG